MRLLLPIAIVASFVALIVGWIAFSGMSARTVPGAIETYLARSGQRLAIPKQARAARIQWSPLLNPSSKVGGILRTIVQVAMPMTAADERQWARISTRVCRTCGSQKLRT